MMHYLKFAGMVLAVIIVSALVIKATGMRDKIAPYLTF